LGKVFFWCNYFVFLMIKLGFLFMWSAFCTTIDPDCCSTIMLDDYFKTNPGVKDLPWPGIESQSPSPQPVVMAMSYDDPNDVQTNICKTLTSVCNTKGEKEERSEVNEEGGWAAYTLLKYYLTKAMQYYHQKEQTCQKYSANLLSNLRLKP